MSNRSSSKKSSESSRYATRLLSLEDKRSRRQPNQSKEMAPFKACRNLLKSDDWESSKFSLIPKSSSKKQLVDRKSSTTSIKEVKTNKHSKNREKVVIVSKKSSSVRVVKSGSQKCVKGVQRSVSVKKVSYSTSVVLTSDDDDDEGDDEDESDSEEDDDDEEDEDYEDLTKVPTRRKDTVIKHTMSKIRTNCSRSKSTDNQVNKRMKSIKIKEKTSTKRKSSIPSRELRPRFPYTCTQEWPTARAHRMASLNAMAKVHVLYENEGRTHGEPEENNFIDLLNDHSSNDIKPLIRDIKPLISLDREKDKSPKPAETTDRRRKNVDVKPKIVKKRRKRKQPCDVEIIDTKMCKRMASLNAQAILAASYVQEKPKKREKIKIENKSDSDMEFKGIFVESCNLQIMDSIKTESPLISDSASLQDNTILSETTETNSSLAESKDSFSPKGVEMFQNQFDDKNCIPEIPTSRNDLHLGSTSGTSTSVAKTSVSEVGVTKVTKVTKVQINTTKEMEIKEEGNAERKIGRIVEQDDVAITRMYEYQSSASQKYCVTMETTFKPNSRSFPQVVGSPRSGGIPAPHVMGAVMPTRQSYYNYQNRPGLLASQSYPMNRNMQPMMPLEQHMHTRQYGTSAFTMPHYGHSQPIPYPHNEYGYYQQYQPAGPMIQPTHEQYMIHKPVPCHPQPHQQIHQAQPPARSAAAGSSREARNTDSNTNFQQMDSNSSRLKQNVQSMKHVESGRPAVSSPAHFSSSRSTNVQARPPKASADIPQQVPAKQYQNQEHSKHSIKCQHARDRNYLHQEHHSYPMSNQRSCHGIQQQQPLPAHHSKLQSPAMHNSGHDLRSQYVHTNQPTSSSHGIVPKIEHSDPQFSESAKYNMPKYETTYKESTESCDKNSVWRPPLVMDLDNSSKPKNTKTYIELDVPKACPRDRIVVVDVDKEEKEHVRKRNAASISHPTTRSSQPNATESPSPAKKPMTEDKFFPTKDIKKEAIESQSKDPVDATLNDGSKKKEPSALIRRAKLHGKQRTYRDSENRPLVPYSNAKKASSDVPAQFQKPAFQPQVSLPHLTIPRGFETKKSYAWSWTGKPVEKLNDDPPFLRLCYPAMRHYEGDVIKVRDCVLLKSGARKTDLPYIAKVAALWENPNDGEMTMSLCWYYRPEHTEAGRKPHHTDGEIFASRHSDTNSVACIEDKCYVLTFGEYCRYRRHCRMLESTFQSPMSVVPPIDDYPRRERLPPSCISPEMVFFCRRVYDFRQKRLLKNPS